LEIETKGASLVKGEILSQPLCSIKCGRGGWVQSFSIDKTEQAQTIVGHGVAKHERKIQMEER